MAVLLKKKKYMLMLALHLKVIVLEARETKRSDTLYSSSTTNAQEYCLGDSGAVTQKLSFSQNKLTY